MFADRSYKKSAFYGNERMLIAHDSNRLRVGYLLHYSSAHCNLQRILRMQKQQ